MKIQVTQGDIDSGVRNNCTMCPVALAIKGQSNLEHIAVSRFDVSFWRDHHWAFSPLPFEVIQFIAYFDEGKTVEPFIFDLEGV